MRSAEDAYAKIRAGASLLQIYTALVYEGPGLVERIKQGLAAKLRADGFTSIAQAVGADHRGTGMSVPLLAGIAPLADRYDGYILDLWGVLHDGAHPLPGAVDALHRLREQGKHIVILSNAPRRAAAVIKRIEEIGISRSLYDELLSSGEATWRWLKQGGIERPAALSHHGRARCEHAGGSRSRSDANDRRRGFHSQYRGGKRQ